MVDGMIMPEGFRVHIAIDVVARRGSTFTIRKFRAEPYTVIDLINLKTLDPLVAAYLWMLVENLQSTLIVGPTAAGKTTLLNAIALLLPPEIKVITIEETPELNLFGHENWISLITRTSTEEGVVNVTLYELLKNALRQRPDVIIVGELRGEEAYTFFQAISLGHGGLATIHADDVGTAFRRLLAEPFNIPKYLLQLVKVYVGLGKVEVGEGVSRRVLEVKEVEGLDPRTGDIILSTVFRWVRSNDSIVFTGHSHVIKAIAERRHVFNDLLRRATLMKWLAKRKVSISELRNIVRAYRADWATLYLVAESEVGPYELPS
jgi:flagellar protein FlaI